MNLVIIINNRSALSIFFFSNPGSRSQGAAHATATVNSRHGIGSRGAGSPSSRPFFLTCFLFLFRLEKNFERLNQKDGMAIGIERKQALGILLLAELLLLALSLSLYGRRPSFLGDT